MISQGDEHVQMLEDCEKRSEKLTEWEQQFIDSLGHQIDCPQHCIDGQVPPEGYQCQWCSERDAAIGESDEPVR